ncbi:MAG: DUF58 domain-containing protein, partial [Anaerolineae bacterium]
ATLRAAEATPNIASVRPFTPGDTLRRIHWPTTARRDDLYVKEYDREPAGDLWIILDLQADVQAGTGEKGTEEFAVTLAASLADAFLRQNRSVGLLAEGDSYILLPPETGETQLWRILHRLASAQATGTRPLAELIAGAAPVLRRGITAALITPSLEPAWLSSLADLQQRGIGASVMLLDATSFGREGNLEAMVTLLSDRGVPVRVIGQSFRFRPIVERRRQRPTYKVLGTGRVIAVPPAP